VQKRGMESYCLIGVGFQSCTMSSELDGGDGYSAM
jgi:hypothetical protein